MLNTLQNCSTNVVTVATDGVTCYLQPGQVVSSSVSIVVGGVSYPTVVNTRARLIVGDGNVVAEQLSNLESHDYMVGLALGFSAAFTMAAVMFFLRGAKAFFRFAGGGAGE